MVEIVKTREQLIEQAAIELGVKTSGDTLSDEDSDTIDNYVDPLLRQLDLDGVVSIQDSEEIPSEYFLPTARLLANDAARAFGQPYSVEMKMENEKQLRRLTATKPTYETLRSNYF
jgi:hypothetical protein